MLIRARLVYRRLLWIRDASDVMTAYEIGQRKMAEVIEYYFHRLASPGSETE